MATLVLQAQPPHHHARMQVFKGDQDHLLDKLIAASQLREVSLDSLQERTLVPYFDASDASTASYLATQPGRKQAQQSPAGHGLKRHAHERSSAHLAGSPPKKEAELLQARHQRRAKQAASCGSASAASSSGGKGSTSTSTSGSDTEMSSIPARKSRVLAAPAPARKHSRDASATTTAASRAAAASSSGAQRATPPPPSKRPSSNQASLDMRQLAAASAAAAASLRTPGKSGARTPPCPSKFAGPAFTNSPTPDCLPLPTSTLLFQDAADSLRSRLTL
ncbi:hypothetical protein ACK3TF_003234 [Chlorella vulgaris]